MYRSVLIVGVCLLASSVLPAQARTARSRIARIVTPVATLEQVRLQLDWPADAKEGRLQLSVGRMDAPSLGYRYRDLVWSCPLRRTVPAGWECDGLVRAGEGAALQLAVHLDEKTRQARLQQGAARLAVVQSAEQPNRLTLDLTRVPLAWAQALLAQAWPEGRLKAGHVDGQLQLVSAESPPLRMHGPLRLQALAFENVDSSIVAEAVGGAFRLDASIAATHSRLALAGALQGGEFLAGNTYVSLPSAPVDLRLAAEQVGGAGWSLPRIEWRDGGVLQAVASARLTPQGALAALEVQASSDDMTPLKPRYLSGWMGLFGLSGVDLHGAMTLAVRMEDGALGGVEARLDDVSLRDPAGRFVFDGLRGSLRYSAGDAVHSGLVWDSGQLYGLAFGAGVLPFLSANGVLRIPEPVRIPMLGGTLGLRDVVIRPPQGETGTDIRFGLNLADIDFGKVSQAVGLPAFQGRLAGDIPLAVYANERIDFEGGLSLRLFEGKVAFSSLALERPFGTAPSLSADIAMDGLDLLRLTEVLGFGSVIGKLDGRIDGLRLVDWTPVAFNARFITEDAPGVRKRISQRAVQDISSVGGASFLQTLQGKAIALFDDFGYRRIGIGCRLENEICTMSGLHSAGNAFTIVEGAGVPRLDVVGHNRQVDWPTLVERLLAASKGEVAPVID